jgi:hypothetical protein
MKWSEIMQNDVKRNIKISFRVTEDEKEFIAKKSEAAKSSSMGAYIRKMAITGKIVKYENQDLKNLQRSLAGIQRNINQMAVRVNATSRMYDEDFEYLKEVMSGIWQSLESIQSVLLSLKQ